MQISPRQPKSQFDFGAAITQLFNTPGGARWALKLVFWTGLLLAAIYVIGGALIAAPYLSMIENIEDPEAILDNFWAMIPGYLIMTFGALFALAIGETTLHRAVLLNEDTPGLIPLRFGKQELRVFGASLGVWLLALGAFIGVIFIAAIIAGIISVAVPSIGIILILIAYLAGLFIWPFVAIKLSPAAALSVYNDRAHLLAGRHISKYRFWSLFLGFLFIGFVGYVLSMVITLTGMTALIGDSSLFVVSSGEFGDGDGADIAQTFRDKFSSPLVVIGSIIFMLIYSCFVAAWLLSMAGVGSYAVKWWAEEDQVSPFD